MATLPTAISDVEAVEAGDGAICGTAEAEREQRVVGLYGWQCSRAMAARTLTGPPNRAAQRLLCFARDSEIDGSEGLTLRTAVYGPVRTVV